MHTVSRHAGEEPPLDTARAGAAARARAGNRELEMENEFLKKAAAYVCPER